MAVPESGQALNGSLPAWMLSPLSEETNHHARACTPRGSFSLDNNAHTSSTLTDQPISEILVQPNRLSSIGCSDDAFALTAAPATHSRPLKKHCVPGVAANNEHDQVWPPRHGHADSATPNRSSRMLSCFSEPAIDWISRQVGVSDFASTAIEFFDNENCEPATTQNPSDPDIGTAQNWTAAYFDQATDTVFGIVSRSAFEARLKQHYENRNNEHSTEAHHDPAWYAIRNMIFALGSRVRSSNISQAFVAQAFVAAREVSWGYFENAFSVRGLLTTNYQQAGLDAIRALLLMAVYAEEVRSAEIEFMFLANAARMAQLKNMHLQSSNCASTSTGSEEANQRQWLWWMIYSYEKHLAYRSGRPSVGVHGLRLGISLLTPPRQ